MWSAVEGSGSGGAGAAPCARGKHSATLLGGYVYVLGGRGGGGSVPLRDFWRYCLATGEWERLACRGEPPPSLQEHSCTAHGNKLYVFGGEAGALGDTPLWVYDTELGSWRKLPGQPVPPGRRGPRARGGGAGPRGRRGHSAHALKDCLLVFGGYKDLRGSTNELWAFHYESESWHQVRTANAGPARHRHAAALHDARLYVHGGQSDLRACADLWHYDTMSRVWTAVRPVRGSRGWPGARVGHAGLRAGAHFYIFGGEADGHACNELWRFHFATETWERIVQSVNWPSPRVDCCALLVPGAPRRIRSAPAPTPVAPRPDPPASLLKELSRLSSIHMRRAARCSYSALGQDSTESLANSQLSKSHSSYVIERSSDAGPKEADEAERFRSDISREPISVPDFADMVLPTPVLSPIEAAKLVYLDSDEEEDMKREIESMRRKDDVQMRRLDTPKVVAIPKSASVRFSKDVTTTEEEGELSTSDYASAERVNRLSGASLGFCNPHYLGPDVRALAALTPDSGVGAGDIELHDLGERRARSAQRNGGDAHLHLLLVGGREPPHVARLQSPLSLWTYRLL
ncbi:rab9 effector protein with kelch motifs-like [Cydia amplana]|uniref:rab9 effector protein with kelch motifs-like n=1 Tax=Cydia amplana TaxID=1869771 RepID=UPI002FE5093F